MNRFSLTQTQLGEVKMSKMLKNYYDISNFVIWGDAVNENSSRSRLVLSFRDGKPRLTVYTGLKGQTGIISFPCDSIHITTIFNMLKEIAQGEPNKKVSIDSLTLKYVDNKATNELELVSTLYIGKSEEGIVYLAIISENKPKLVFSIRPSRFHVFRDSEKNIIPESQISKMMAISLADLALNLVAIGIMQYTSEDYEVNRQSSKPSKEESSDIMKPAQFDELGI